MRLRFQFFHTLKPRFWFWDQFCCWKFRAIYILSFSLHKMRFSFYFQPFCFLLTSKIVAFDKKRCVCCVVLFEMAKTPRKWLILKVIITTERCGFMSSSRLGFWLWPNNQKTEFKSGTVARIKFMLNQTTSWPIVLKFTDELDEITWMNHVSLQPCPYTWQWKKMGVSSRMFQIVSSY